MVHLYPEPYIGNGPGTAMRTQTETVCATTVDWQNMRAGVGTAMWTQTETVCATTADWQNTMAGVGTAMWTQTETACVTTAEQALITADAEAIM